MTRIARKAWAVVAVAAIEVARLFPGVGRIRARAPVSALEPVAGHGWEELTALKRQAAAFAVVVWAVNALLAVTLVVAVVGAV